MTGKIYPDNWFGGGSGGLCIAAGVVQVEAETDQLAVVSPHCQVISTENFYVKVHSCFLELPMAI